MPLDPDDFEGELRERWKERSAIMQFDAGMTREEAEAKAAKSVYLNEMYSKREKGAKR